MLPFICISELIEIELFLDTNTSFVIRKAFVSSKSLTLHIALWGHDNKV